MAQPEAYISGAADLFGDDSTVKSEDTAKFLGTYMTAFAAWIEKIAPGKP